MEFFILVLLIILVIGHIGSIFLLIEFASQLEIRGGFEIKGWHLFVLIAGFIVTMAGVLSVVLAYSLGYLLEKLEDTWSTRWCNKTLFKFGENDESS